MNTNKPATSDTPPTPSLIRRILRCLEEWWARQTKIAVATYFFGFNMWILGWVNYAIHVATLKMDGHPSQAGERFFCEFFPWITLAFFIVWTFLCFRWRKVRKGDKKVPPKTFLFTVLITLWLSLFMAVSPCAAANSWQTNTVPQMGQTVQVASTPANSPHPHVILSDILLGILYTLATAAAAYMAVLHWMTFLHNTGTGDKPPQSPGKGTNQTQVVSSPLAASRQSLALINTNVGLAAVSFTIQNGVVVSNSAGMNIQPLPSFFSENGAPVESGGFITNTQPGITVPPSMSVWAETNSYADTNLDPVYPYVAVFNYTMLTSTNLIDWQEAYTVVGWANDNPQVPLQCLITYTNGTPMTTNWEQFYLDSSGQITNIVVYGALPTVNTNNAYVLNLVHPNGGPPIPPGAGSGGSTNDVPFNSTAQFFRLTCNTNEIVTHWP